jgi:hypothetical protein
MRSSGFLIATDHDRAVIQNRDALPGRRRVNSQDFHSLVFSAISYQPSVVMRYA